MTTDPTPPRPASPDAEAAAAYREWFVGFYGFHPTGDDNAVWHAFLAGRQSLASPDREGLREGIARVIDPSSWCVLDSYLADMKRKYKGQNVGYDPEAFRDKKSLAKADAILALLPLLPVPFDKKTMCLTPSDAEVDALEKLSAQKDLSREGIYRSALRIYQLIAIGHSRLVDVEPDTRLAPPVPSEEQVEAACVVYHGEYVGEERAAWQIAWEREVGEYDKSRRRMAMRAVLRHLSPPNPPTGEGK